MPCSLRKGAPLSFRTASHKQTFPSANRTIENSGSPFATGHWQRRQSIIIRSVDGQLAKVSAGTTAKLPAVPRPSMSAGARASGRDSRWRVVVVVSAVSRRRRTRQRRRSPDAATPKCRAALSASAPLHSPPPDNKRRRAPSRRRGGFASPPAPPPPTRCPAPGTWSPPPPPPFPRSPFASFRACLAYFRTRSGSLALSKLPLPFACSQSIHQHPVARWTPVENSLDVWWSRT
ncbi:hypothetical protein HPB50_018575 [Hyalomma asiaticum]|uniref:Uncharacterized protein n=1 Tax=Hyalomma asiaticum TaxID=266040 RepID=A0ACB7SXS7_HYAAI|nr:hypothetical protein HPB50_018575 [Hyalomma asiaticum]